MRRFLSLTVSLLTIVLLFCFMPTAHASSQAPSVVWTKCYGGAKNDVITALCETTEQGYAAAGYTNSNEGDIPANSNILNFDWVMKLGSNSNIGWSQIFAYEDFPQSITQSGKYLRVDERISLGNYEPVTGEFLVSSKYVSLANGTKGTYMTQPTFYINYFLKDNLGFCDKDSGGKEIFSDNPEWTIDPGIVDAIKSPSVYRTSDNGCIAFCSANAASVHGANNHSVGSYVNPYDILLLKLDASHNITWAKMLGGAGDDFIDATKPCADGGFIIAGHTNSSNGDVQGNHGNQDVWIIKLDKSSNIQWKKCFGGSGDDVAKDIIETSDHGFAVACTTTSGNGDVSGSHGNTDFWIFSVDSKGALLWQKCLGGSGKDEPRTIIQAVDGSLLIAGSTYSTNGDVSGHHGTASNADGWIVKLKAPSAQLSAPTNIKASPASYNSVKLAWGKVSGAAGYEIYRKTGSGAYSLVKTISSGTTLAWTNTGLTTGATYSYKLKAFSGTKKSADSAVVSAKPLPDQVTGIKAGSTSYNSIKLAWKKVQGASSYIVQRSTGKNGAYTTVKTLTKNTFADTGLKTGRTYYYRICAFRTVAGVKVKGAYSSIVNAVPVLSKPGSLKVNKASAVSAKITWSKVSGANGYEVYRSLKMDAGFAIIKTITKNTTVSCTDTGLSKGSKYYYKVRAYRMVDGSKVYSPYTGVKGLQL